MARKLHLNRTNKDKTKDIEEEATKTCTNSSSQVLEINYISIFGFLFVPKALKIHKEYPPREYGIVVPKIRSENFYTPLKVVCNKVYCPFQIPLPNDLSTSLEELLFFQLEEALQQVDSMRDLVAELITTVEIEKVSYSFLIKLIFSFYEGYKQDKIVLSPTKRRRADTITNSTVNTTTTMSFKSELSVKTSKNNCKVFGKDTIKCQTMINEKIKENERLRDTILKLQGKLKSKEKEIRELRIKMSSQDKESQLAMAQFQEKKNCDFKNAIAEKNVRIGQLSKELETLKRNLEREQNKTRRLLRADGQRAQKCQKFDCCVKLPDMEQKIKELTEINARLSKDLDIKYKEVDKLSTSLGTERNRVANFRKEIKNKEIDLKTATKRVKFLEQYINLPGGFPKTIATKKPTYTRASGDQIVDEVVSSPDQFKKDSRHIEQNTKRSLREKRLNKNSTWKIHSRWRKHYRKYCGGKKTREYLNILQDSVQDHERRIVVLERQNVSRGNEEQFTFRSQSILTTEQSEDNL